LAVESSPSSSFLHTMWIIALTYACLASVGLGQRMHMAREPLHGIRAEEYDDFWTQDRTRSNSPRSVHPKLLQSTEQVGRANKFGALSTLLLAFNPAGLHGRNLPMTKTSSHSVSGPARSRSDAAALLAADSETGNDSFLKKTRLSRREAVIKALLVGVASSGLASTQTQPAFAGDTVFSYNVIAVGNLTYKAKRKSELDAILTANNFSDSMLEDFEENTEVMNAWAESKQVEADIKGLEKNTKIVQELRSDILAGKANFSSVLAFAVPNMSAAVEFWTTGIRALVLDTKIVAGKNVTTIAFGPTAISGDDGGKLALEMTEERSKQTTYEETENGFQHLQLGIPSLRMSKIMENGGEIRSAYGWTDVVTPGGLPVRFRIDDKRRDPFQWVGWRVSNLPKAVKYFEALGMKVISREKTSRIPEYKLGGTWGVYDATPYDVFEPYREAGAVRMSFGDPVDTFGLFLLGPRKASKAPKNPSATLRVVSKTAAGTTSEFEGLRIQFVSPDEAV